MTILLAALLAQAVTSPAPQNSTPPVCAGGLLQVRADEPCPFLLFFDSSEWEISRDAAATLGQAVAAATSGGYSRIVVAGHSDRSGSSPGNQRVSRTRAEAVRQALVAQGIAAATITVEAHGEKLPIIATEDGVREPQNRRVEIRLQR